jgi:hypothetical protein
MTDNDIKIKITQLLNQGFAFSDHLTKRERDSVEADLIAWYAKNGTSSFVEEEMVYVIDYSHDIIMTLEITKNSIYFNPREHIHLLDVVVTTLEFITDRFSEEEEEIPEDDDSTEEIPKPKPNFDIL